VRKGGVPDFGTLPYSINPAKANERMGIGKPPGHPAKPSPKTTNLQKTSHFE
jgi:hypothetical protein